MNFPARLSQNIFVLILGIFFLLPAMAQAAPSCYLYASATSVPLGQPVTLTWAVQEYSSYQANGPVNEYYGPYRNYLLFVNGGGNDGFLYRNGSYMTSMWHYTSSYTVYPSLGSQTYGLYATNGVARGRDEQNNSYSSIVYSWCARTVTAYIGGCTDPAASNYNASATTNDGSCVYPVPGCTDPTATNYNASATTNDGSCTYATEAPDISLTADKTLVRAGDEVALSWNPNGFSGMCSLSPDQYFPDSVATTSGSETVTVEAETEFEYSCTGSSSIYTPPSNNQSVTTTVQVVPRVVES